jgi:hypothetical protein
MNQLVYILKVSNQNEDGSYDYVKVAGVFAKREDAIVARDQRIERMRTEWWGCKVKKHNSDTVYIKSETGIYKWYEIMEMPVK